MKLLYIGICALILAWGEIPAAEAEGLEGTEWRLVEVAGKSVPELPGERHPYIALDPTKKKAAGLAGCNRFSTPYEFDGPSLRFGPVVSTRRACEEPGNWIETAFLDSLRKASAWKISNDSLFLSNGADILARFLLLKKGNEPDISSMTFQSALFPSGSVTLSKGEYRNPAMQGSAEEVIVRLSDKRAFGKFNNREAGAAVITTSTGGTGTFYALALLVNEDAGWVNTDTVMLGDRVAVRSVEMNTDHIVVRLTTHGPGDPMCCPTQETVKRFAVRGSHLIPAQDGAGEEGSETITGTVWHWVRSHYNNDTKNVPSEPENYTVRFLKDGTINVKADCNSKGGTYSVEGKKLSIRITHSTMAVCREGSLEEPFIRDLSAAGIYFMKDGNLYIDLKFDTGTMKFSQERE